MSKISDRLRELRGPSSQTEMATAVNVKQQNWARWESGAVTPSAEMIATICKVHACSADWLLGIDKPSSVTVHGSGNAIATGSHATVSVVTNPANCKTCPHLKKLKQLEKLIAK